MRCAVYVRVSTEMESQKTSIAHQKSFFKKYIEDKGWELYKIYEDHESGRKVKGREGLKALLKDSKESLFRMVLTKSISRFARNTLEGLIIIRDLKARKIRFVTIEDGFDSCEYDEFMLTLLLSIAQKESEKISERIKFGKACKAKKGGFNGSIPPLGYKRMDKDTLVPSQDGSIEIVKKIFSMYLKGFGAYKIAKYLNEKGYPTPTQISKQKKSSWIWHQSTIRKILSNPVYIGNMVQKKSVQSDYECSNKICIENTHKGIIDPCIFYEVQRRLKAKTKEKSSKSTHLFSGLLYCGECQSSMHYKKDRKAYLCGKVNKMGKKYCKGSYIREDDLKRLIQRDLESVMDEYMDHNKDLETLKKNICNEKMNEKKIVIQKKIKRMIQMKDRVVDLLVKNVIDEKIYLKKSLEIQQELKKLKANQEKIKENMEKNKGEQKKIEKTLIFQEMDYSDIHFWIGRIDVFKDSKIMIHYNFQKP